MNTFNPALSSAGELVQIVDRDNRPVGSEPRRVMRSRNLIHRASYIFVFNRQAELFIQRRTLTKDIYPGFWDAAAGGVMLAGETDYESASRELAEELGVIGAPLDFLFHHYFETASNRVWGAVYRCLHDGPFILQAEEVAEGRFLPVAEVLRLSTQEPFTPDALEILRIIQRQGQTV